MSQPLGRNKYKDRKIRSGNFQNATIVYKTLCKTKNMTLHYKQVKTGENKLWCFADRPS